MKYYHGTSHNLNNGFQNIGLRNDNSYKEISYGYYFTNSFETAFSYCSDKQNAFIYEINIDNLKENQILLIDEAHYHDSLTNLSYEKLLNIVIQSNSLKDIMNHYYQDNDFNLSSIKHNFNIHSPEYLKDITDMLMIHFPLQTYKSCYPKLLNLVIHDFFSESNSEIEKGNRLFVQEFDICCFQQNLKNNKIHLCFFR